MLIGCADWRFESDVMTHSRLQASTDPAICHAFGDCVGSNSTAPEIGLAICGEPHPSCEQADESSVKAVYVLSADSILDAASGNPGWLRGMASAVAKPQAVVIATDAFAVRFAELSFPGTGVTLAPAWCGDHGDNFAAIETGGHSSNFVAGYLPVSPTVLVYGDFDRILLAGLPAFLGAMPPLHASRRRPSQCTTCASRADRGSQSDVMPIIQCHARLPSSGGARLATKRPWQPRHLRPWCVKRWPRPGLRQATGPRRCPSSTRPSRTA